MHEAFGGARLGIVGNCFEAVAVILQSPFAAGSSHFQPPAKAASS